MSRVTTRLLKTALSALHYSGVGSLVSPLTRGQGVIFTLHQVQPGARPAFDPNGILSVTPAWLDSVLTNVRDAGFDIIALDEAVERIAGRSASSRPFACFTFDDAYRDNLTHAYPVMKRHGAPFTVYVPTDFPDGRGELWWLVVEQVVRISRTLNFDLGNGLQHFPCSTVSEKQAAYDAVYWHLRHSPETEARQSVREMAAAAGVDIAAMCRELIMTWDELRLLARDPLVTIGAHTRGHFAVGKLSAADARQEISASIERVEQEIGLPCRHFSFPYGDEASAAQRDFDIAAELGLASAVTTRKGLIRSDARHCLTGLPRVSLNGDYQRSHYVDVLLTGAPFAFWNLFKRAQPSAY